METAFSCFTTLGTVALARVVVTQVTIAMVESWLFSSGYWLRILIFSNSFLVLPAQIMDRVSTLSALSPGVPLPPSAQSLQLLTCSSHSWLFQRLCADILLLVNQPTLL